MRFSRFLVAILCWAPNFLFAQSKAVLKLEEKVYRLNNNFKYDESQAVIQHFLCSGGITEEDSYYAYLYLSFTYKRLFDYKSTLSFLDKALEHGEKTEKKEFCTNNIRCQKALAYFDIHLYQASDSLMKLLKVDNYQHLDDEHKSKIFMQEAYLLGLGKRYAEAEARYDLAIKKMMSSSPCDLPMIYGKKIQLYGAEKREQKMYEMYRESIKSAESCKILKYVMYTNQMMADAFEKIGKYRKALYYYRIYDSLNMIYDEKDHLDKVTELDKKYQAEKKEQEIALQKTTIESKNASIALLIISITGLALIGLLLGLRRRQKKMEQEKQRAILYTKQLLEKTEEERKRIASNLHDSISHELLVLKTLGKNDASAVNSKIDAIINDIRIISRDMHPVMFDKVGLQNSIEQLVERTQANNDFMVTSEIAYSNALSGTAELQVYRIVQEALSNIIKYADAIAAKITIEERSDQIHIEIKDNGKGFDVNEIMGGGKAFGLHNIIERSRAIGGMARIHSGSGGTIVTVEIVKKQLGMTTGKVVR